LYIILSSCDRAFHWVKGAVGSSAPWLGGGPLSGESSLSETKLNAGLVAEVALVVVPLRKIIAKAG
jgi:hypothetical protein